MTNDEMIERLEQRDKIRSASEDLAEVISRSPINREVESLASELQALSLHRIAIALEKLAERRE